MARLPKCPECEYQVDKDTQRWFKHSGKTYHEECYQKFEVRKTHRNELLAYICELYKIPVPNGFMLKQIKEFQEDYGYTLKGMELALKFFHSIKKNSVDGRGIGIIPYIYDDAREYYTQLAIIKQKALEAGFNDKIETIYVKRPTMKTRKNYIDIEGITE